MHTMSVRQRPADLGTEDARSLTTSVGKELRQTRIALGLSQRFVASAAGASASQLGRLERGEGRKPSLGLVCRAARVLGLEASLKLYASGVPVRDAAHLALLGRFEAMLGAPLRMRREVALPIAGDPRAWDAVVVGAGAPGFAEGESRLGDMQASVRRIELKLRDDGRGSVVILVVARTRHNLSVLREHRESLRTQLPLDGAAIARALRAGHIPSASGIIVL
jgi:transcriptional regulator with XRE-family HTH domain